MKKIIYTLATLSVIAGMAWVTAPTTLAVNVFEDCDSLDPSSDDYPAVCKDRDENALPGYIRQIISILLFALGLIAVIFIIVAGIMYATSGGNSEQVKKSKDTIMYALIGLVVATLSYALVNFVLGSLEPKDDSETTNTMTGGVEER